MVLFGYIQKTPHFCVVDNNTTGTPATVNEYRYEREKVSRPSVGLLGPATRILRTGADVLHNKIRRARDGLTEEERLALRKKGERIQILNLRMKNAETMETWRSAAKELDVLEDNEAWKLDSSSPDFDAALIEARTKQMDTARIDCDIKKMLALVRTTLSRDLGGMGNMRLYKHSYIGTKDLIEKYIESTLDTINALVETSKHALPSGLETKDILEQVVYARQAFGRSALLLSGGATFGMNHVGVLKALFEARLLPRIISGASAGSIVCAVLCTRTDQEIPDVLKKFPYGDLAVFEENGNEDGVLDRIRRLLTEGAWIDIKHLTRVMRELVGDMTFQEAYNRSRRILNICVSSASVYELPRLLNYVTAPNVMIWSAVAASCSVPFLFSAAELLVKNPLTGENSSWNPTPQRWIDGSVDNDLPMTRLAEMFNVNHFIVSQVNPHVIPFIAKDEEAIKEAVQKEGNGGPGWVYNLTHLAKAEALHRMQVLAELGVFPNLVTKCKSILSQKYSGDITILPEINYKDFPRILKNPTSEYMVQACLSGERATWPKLSRVWNHCAVELELDAAVQKLRARVVFSPSEVNLRRLRTVDDSQQSMRRQRADGGNLLLMSRDEGGAFVEQNGKRKTLSRPPLRASASVLEIKQRHQSSGYTRPRSAQTTPQRTPRLGQEDEVFRFPVLSKDLQVKNQIRDLSSAGETTLSPPSSDADAESQTDESSTEVEPEEAMDNIAGSTRERQLDLFSRNQPITPATDRVLATSPSFIRNAPGLTYSPTAVSPIERRPR
ncbi:Lipase 5 [Ciborinia camelliae]|nr:Lipase 5 [Ciborinia camelliae]